MNPYLRVSSDRDRDAIRTISAFLRHRLAERQTIEWALKTSPNEVIKRSAILELLEFSDNLSLKEPWFTAWRLIQESWDGEPLGSSIEAYRAKRRILAGERSGALIAAIVSFVCPRLRIEPTRATVKPVRSRRPRHVEDFYSASLTSHELVDLSVYQLDSISDAGFLAELAIALEGAVNRGIAIGRRLGWRDDHRFWQLGQLYSVSYQRREVNGHQQDVDQFHRGIAPSVKLLDAVITRLSAIDVEQAKSLIIGWKQGPTRIHLRLWASLSRIPTLTSTEELSEVLTTLDDRAFWDVHSFPELAELRALRFGEMSDPAREKIELRIKKGPSRDVLPRDIDPDRLNRVREYRTVLEYRRIEVAGNRLSNEASGWVVDHLSQFPDLRNMSSVRFGFLQSAVAAWVRPRSEERFNELVGEDRLQALEAALITARKNWEEDPAERASDWIREGDNAVQLVGDLELTANGGAAYPNTWDRLGWSLKPPNRNDAPTQRDVGLGRRVLHLLAQLPNGTLEASIKGVSYWMSAWSHVIVHFPELPAIWLKLWPLGVDATNLSSVDPEGVDLNELVATPRGEEPEDLDTLNVPVGHLIDVFLRLCPNLDGNENPFRADDLLRRMRDLIIAAEGKAGLIGRHRLVEELPYFLSADEVWARENLITPLDTDDERSLALWRAIARRTQFTKVLRIIGDQTAAKVLDRRLGRDRRGILLSSLVIESLNSFLEGRIPVVPNAKVQQTLRAVDDEVRSTAAQTVRRYLSETARRVEQPHGMAAENIFETAVAPFLQQVWPQERSLATRGVTAEFARLPASAGQAFAEAVDAIEPFLVPFDCWSIADFGFWDEPDGTARLTLIDSPAKSAALLRLLDLSIGTSEGSVAPIDLHEALDQIQNVSQPLTHDPNFRRLATVARRR